MIAIAVDDERWALSDLTTILKEQERIDSVNGFLVAKEALKWAEQNAFDIAFLDINMRGIDGIELAKALRKINKNCYIIFCTGFDDHTMDAIELHCNGYLLKPIMPEKVRAELDYIASLSVKEKLLTVRCFGGFEVFDKEGKPLVFKRQRAKELLAVLVDKNGTGITAKELSARLFEDDGMLDKKNNNYVYKLIQELNRALAEADATDVMKKAGYRYYLDMTLIDLDETGKGETGYMEEFNWSV